MSALATPDQLVTVTLGWREPNGQVVQFGGAGSADPAATATDSSAPAPAPVATSSGSPSFSGQAHPADSSNGINLLA